EILPLPGHSPGHIGVWEPSSRTAIVMDAVLGNGLLDTDGNVIHPPPIVDTTGYEASVRLLQKLAPERLLTAHYDVMEGAAVGRFLKESLAFVERARRAVSTGGDVPLRELLDRANAELAQRLGEPTIRVNNAGINRIGPSETLQEERWQEVIDVNLTGTFRCAQAAGQRMLAAGRGSIVNVASISAFVAMPGRAAYCATKGGSSP